MNEHDMKACAAWARTVAWLAISLGGTIFGCNFIYEERVMEMKRAEIEVQIAAINAGLHQQPLLNGETGWVKIENDGSIKLED